MSKLLVTMMKISLCYALLFCAALSSAHAETPELPPVPLALPTLPSPVQADKNTAAVTTAAAKENPAQAVAKALPLPTSVVVPAQVTAAAVTTAAAKENPAQADAKALPLPTAVVVPAQVTAAAVTTATAKENPAQAVAKALPLPTAVVVPAQVTAAAVTTAVAKENPAQADAKAVQTSAPATVAIDKKTTSQADANAGQTTTAGAAAAPVGKTDPLAKALPGWKGSLMFTAAEMKMVQEALDSVGADAEVDNTPQRSDVPMTSSSKNFMSDIAANLAPTYYLNSILYVSPTNWTVWVNGVQYSSELHGFDSEALKGLMVEHISPQSVRFTSKIRLLDRIAPGWKDKFSIDAKGNFMSMNIKNLTVSKEKDMISFTLQPNQRFAVSTMEINEGMLP